MLFKTPGLNSWGFSLLLSARKPTTFRGWVVDDGNIRPRFYYVGSKTNWKRKHRFCYNKKRLNHIFKGVDNTMTEETIAEQNGSHRIYDCGFLRYTYDNRGTNNER
jgi:hypothetical protein